MKMKKIFALLLPLLVLQLTVKAQIRNVFVEKYYVSDSLDATDTIDGAAHILPKGSTTYRVYVQLNSGYKIKKIYGTANHPLRFTSTDVFYNNVDRPTAYFGYLINKAWFTSNPTLALDSWLTLGLCATQYNGVMKADDSDGSLIGGTHNTGGTAGVSGGILVNNDTAAGIALTSEDGMRPKTGTFSTWINNGFIDSPFGTDDTTVFGPLNSGKQFFSRTAYLQQNSGVSGDSATGHKVLVAQLTTKGELSFEINLQLLDSIGGSHNYVAVNNASTVPAGDTAVYGNLKFPPDPPACGCTDPNFIEYNPTLTCSDPYSCLHRVVYGCMDTLACNYDPAANFHLQSLCCYPGMCNNRDIALVCPGISTDATLQLFPNPASSEINVQFTAGQMADIKIEIFDAYGTIVLLRDLDVQSGVITQNMDISNLQPGLYMLKVFTGNYSVQSKSFMKQ